MYMDRKIQYCQDVSSFQLVLQIQSDPNQYPSKLLCEYDKQSMNNTELGIIVIQV